MFEKGSELLGKLSDLSFVSATLQPGDGAAGCESNAPATPRGPTAAAMNDKD